MRGLCQQSTGNTWAVVQKTEIIELFSEKGSICKAAGNYAIWFKIVER